MTSGAVPTPGQPVPGEPTAEQLDRLLVADEQLVQALAGGVTPARPADPLVALLAAWRDEARGVAPAGTAAAGGRSTGHDETLLMPAVVDPDDPEQANGPDDDATVVPLSRSRLRRLRNSSWRARAVAIAAVLLTVFTLGGMAAVASNAQPGSPLWALTKIINKDHANSVEARQAVQQAMREAEREAQLGDRRQALLRLQEAKSKLSSIKPGDGKDALSKQIGQLEAQVNGHTPPPTPTPSPTRTVVASPTPTSHPSSPTPTASHPVETPSAEPSTTEATASPMASGGTVGAGNSTTGG